LGKITVELTVTETYRVPSVDAEEERRKTIANLRADKFMHMMDDDRGLARAAAAERQLAAMGDILPQQGASLSQGYPSQLELIQAERKRLVGMGVVGDDIGLLDYQIRVLKLQAEGKDASYTLPFKPAWQTGLDAFGPILLCGLRFGGSGSGMGGMFSGGQSRQGLTNFELVVRAGAKAQAAIPGRGNVAGIAKHTYATNLLERYQQMYGTRGLDLNRQIGQGLGSARPDVFDNQNNMIYDWKFGAGRLGNAQRTLYQGWFPGAGVMSLRYPY
jgi:hypothetical protein